MTYNEFKKVSLEDICFFGNGKVAMDAITLNNYISTENMIPEKGGITLASSLPNANTVSKYEKLDVLVSNIRPYFKKIWFATKNGGSSNDVLVIKNRDSQILDNKYLYYSLSNDDFFNYVTATSKGTKMPRGDKGAILKYEVFLPEINEQKEIANILSSLDGKIETNNQINNTLEEMAAEIFKQWFVDFEFPNENGEPYSSSGGEMVESELGTIPKGWENGRITELGDLIMGQSPKGDTYNFVGNGLGLVNGASDFKNGEIKPLKYTTDPKKKSQKGDWIFGVRATVGNVTYVDKEYCLGRGVGVLRSKEDKFREFLYFILVSSINYLEKTALGSVYINLTKSDFENIKVNIPDRRTIESLYNLSGPIFKKINLLREENRKLIEMRDTLLPKLMSGEIRVPVEV